MCLDLPSNIPKSHDDNRGIRWVELLRVSQRHLVAITKTIIQIRYHQCPVKAKNIMPQWINLMWINFNQSMDM